MNLPGLRGHPTIPELATKYGMCRRTLLRRLLAMREQDEHIGRVPDVWMYWAGNRWRVNTSRLEREHPELLDLPTISEMTQRIGHVEDRVDRLRSDVDQMASQFAKLRHRGTLRDTRGGGKR